MAGKHPQHWSSGVGTSLAGHSPYLTLSKVQAGSSPGGI